MRSFPISLLAAALTLACAATPFPPVPVLDFERNEEHLPQRAAAQPAAPPGVYYVVRRGDTLHDIALRHGANVEALERGNHLADPNRLEVGQVIVLPPGSRPLARPRPRPMQHVRHTAPTPRAPHASSAPRPEKAIVTPEPVSTASFVPVDCTIVDTGESLRSARFEQAIEEARQARSMLQALDPQPGVSERIARVEVLSGIAEVALGRESEARASFERALDADPQLTLAPGEVSPKILRVFEDARTRPERQASR